MAKPFEEFVEEYDRWYEENKDVYINEVNLIKSLLPDGLKSLEIGIGTGRFSLPLKMKIGLDPSKNMLSRAKKQGIDVVCGKGEELPFKQSKFGLVLMVTTVCFLEDVVKTFEEVYRILKKSGLFVLGIIDRDSPLGREYERKKQYNKFYKQAHFLSTKEVIELLDQCGFKIIQIKQCILPDKPISFISNGFGKGGFVGIKSKKTDLSL